MIDVSRYTCPSCGEEVTIPVDPTAGSHQEYGEDCPVCCRPVVLRIEIHPDSTVSVEPRAE